MPFVSKEEILKLVQLKKFGADLVVNLLMQIFKLKKIREFYAEREQLEPLDFINEVLNYLEVEYEILEADIKKIPANEAFIVISNHPFGGIDALIMYKIISQQRSDFKILTTIDVKQIKPLEDCFFYINNYEKKKKSKETNYQSLKSVFEHIQKNGCLGVFPSGEVAAYSLENSNFVDRTWDIATIKLIKSMNVPVIPLNFQASENFIINILGKIHPLLKTVRLSPDIFTKKDKVIKIRIGTPISKKEQSAFTDNEEFGRFLRARTYSLVHKIEVNPLFFKPKFRWKKPQPISEAKPIEQLVDEINTTIEKYLLFSVKEFKVFCAPAQDIPVALHELGRLREITFREVGEGTNKDIDLDEYDIYYHHLIIWDEVNRKIVGAYRIGKGKDILALYGINGFYVTSLFDISNKLEPILQQSLELGRSFIIKEYQRKPLPLYLLWKGLLYFVLKNQEYRYLTGPVSISNQFSEFSKSLIVQFIHSHYFNHELAQYVKSRKKFSIPKDIQQDINTLVKQSAKNLNVLDDLIYDIESDLRIPVLLKKYLSIGAKIVSFNIDPKFNNCLDGLIILDIFDIPSDVILNLSKEMLDNSVLERFKINTDD
ncbi:MAG: GNAT family N-acyltransferase [Bacteroidales bacterium]